MERYDSYPLWIPFLSTGLMLSIYGLGVCLVASLGWGPVLLYLLYCLWIEGRVLQKSCVYCVYYGKTCGAGKGRICPIFFRRKDPSGSANRRVTWWTVLPDLLTVGIPFALGAALLVWDFEWLRLLVLLAFAFLATAGNGWLRRTLLCRNCKRADLGCPALQLFDQTGS